MMLNYLQEMLGISASESVWFDEDRLPQYLRSKRSYSLLRIEDTQFLLIRIKASDFSIQSYLKQMDKLRLYWNNEIILCFDQLSNAQRKVLIEQKLSFIVPSKQMYIPALGAIFQRHSEKAIVKVEHFSASTQQVFLYALYNASLFPITKIKVAKNLSLSPMTVTRAVQVLEDLHLVKCERVGRSDHIHLLFTGRALYDKARPYLISPIKKIIHTYSNAAIMHLPISGEDALAAMSMLVGRRYAIRAIGAKEYEKLPSVETIDPAWQLSNHYTELEIWKYDPCLFVKNGMVDVVSLCVSLSDKQDERIEEAIEEVLEAHKW